MRLFGTPWDEGQGPDLWERIKGGLGRLRSRKEGKVSSRAAPAPVDLDTSLHVDELLRKINAQGMDSLTAEEKAFLEEASRKYEK